MTRLPSQTYSALFKDFPRVVKREIIVGVTSLKSNILCSGYAVVLTVWKELKLLYRF